MLSISSQLKFSFRLLCLTAGVSLTSSSPSLAFGGMVDFLSTQKICPAAWTWREKVPQRKVPNPNGTVCEKAVKVIPDTFAPPVRTLSPDVTEVLVATAEISIDISPDYQDVERKVVEQVIAQTIKDGTHKLIYDTPTISNPEYLASNYEYYGKVSDRQLVPSDTVLSPRAVIRGKFECTVYQLGADHPYFRDCIKPRYFVDVFGSYRKVVYTLPTKRLEYSVDPSCVEFIYLPEENSIGRSDPYESFKNVTNPKYKPVDGVFVEGASRSEFVCPAGVQAAGASNQATAALNWLSLKEGPLDGADPDVEASIRYLKALALEKEGQLTLDQLRSIFRLHQQFPKIAFAGQESHAEAVETSPESIEEVRGRWLAIEEKLAASDLSPARKALNSALSELKATLPDGETLRYTTSERTSDVVEIDLKNKSFVKLALSPYRAPQKQVLIADEGQIREEYVAFGNVQVNNVFQPYTEDYRKFVQGLIDRLSAYQSSMEASGWVGGVETQRKLISYLSALNAAYGEKR